MINLENIKELYYYKRDEENVNIDFYKIKIKSYRIDTEEPERYIIITDEEDHEYYLDLALSSRFNNKWVMMWHYFEGFKPPEEYFFTLDDAKQRLVDVISTWNERYEEQLKHAQDEIHKNNLILDHIILDTVNYHYERDSEPNSRITENESN